MKGSRLRPCLAYTALECGATSSPTGLSELWTGSRRQIGPGAHRSEGGRGTGGWCPGRPKLSCDYSLDDLGRFL